MRGLGQVILFVVAGAVLLGIETQKTLSAPPWIEIEPYHEAVRQAVEAAPYEVGDWTGVDGEVSVGAIALLRPTTITSRLYRHKLTGMTIHLMFVHCSDARDLIGHYPPVCYPGAGWGLVSSQPVDWPIDERDVEGMIYLFTRGTLFQKSSVSVFDVMVLPGRGTARDMDSVTELASDYRRRAYGAAHLQLVFPGSVRPDVQKEVVTEFLSAFMPVIDVVDLGVLSPGPLAAEAQ